MHPNQCKIVGVFLEFILIQAQKEHKFDINDVTAAHINNDALYITIGSSRTEIIQLFPAKQ